MTRFISYVIARNCNAIPWQSIKYKWIATQFNTGASPRVNTCSQDDVKLGDAKISSVWLLFGITLYIITKNKEKFYFETK